MSRVAFQLSVLMAVLLSACAGPRKMYDGPRRPRHQVAILDLNEDSGARVMAVDSIHAPKAKNEGERDHFKGKLALLPGRHTLKVYYELTRYVKAEDLYDVTERVTPSEIPRLTTISSTNVKRITFDAQAGRTYRLEAEHEPLDFPPGAMTWSAWIISEETGAQVATAEEFK